MNSLLRQKPIKDITYLCYRHPKSNIYKLANKEGNVVGTMVAYPEFLHQDNPFNPNLKDEYSLYIKRLVVDKDYRNKGAGRALLNIATADSYERRCHGNVHLIAQSLEGKDKQPQKFYRKCGFNSLEKHQIELIDKAIEENTPLPRYRWITPMYKEKK